MRQLSNIHHYIVFIFILYFIPILSADSKVKESKVKAVYLYQLAQKINWPNEKELTTFRIGLLTNDSALVSSSREIATSSLLKKRTLLLFRYKLAVILIISRFCLLMKYMLIEYRILQIK